MNFTQLLDKGTTTDVRLANWCPSMDLLALVTNDGQLSVHRLNWQRLWSIAPESPVSALCWRPDGKLLAAALEGGDICLLDVENGKTCLKHKASETSVVHMSWIEEDADRGLCSQSSLYEPSSVPRSYYEPSLPSAVPPLIQGRHSLADQAMLSGPPEHLSLLCAANAAGVVSLNAFGSFPLATVSVWPAVARPQRQQANILHAEVFRDFSQMCTICHLGNTGDTHLMLHDISCIGDRRPELQRIAVLASSICTLLKGCEDTLTAAHEEWAAAMNIVAAKMAELQAQLDNHAIPSTPAEELHLLLATGALSPALHHFLIVILGESGLKRVAKAVDAAVAAVGTLFIEHMQPALEAVAFNLGEACSLARCSHWMTPLVLQEEALSTAQATAHGLLLQGEAFRLALVKAGTEYRILFAWLLTTIRGLNEDGVPSPQRPNRFQHEPLRISTFLQRQFSTDSIGFQLSSQEWGEAELPVEKQLPLLTVLAGLGPAITAGVSAGHTFHPQLQLLKKQIKGAFAAAAASITPAVQLLLSVHLAHAPRASPSTPQPLLAFADATEQGAKPGARLCLVLSEEAAGSQTLLFVDMHCCMRDGQAGVEVAAARTKAVTWSPICDVAFYKDGQLAVLCRGSNIEGSEAKLLLLPTKGLEMLAHDLAVLQATSDILQLCCKETDAEEAVNGIRERSLTYSDAHAPLAVSGSRGVACILGGWQRIILLDLEEDEGVADDEEVDEDD